MDTRIAEAFALQQMVKWGLGDWSFVWDNATVRFGSCRHHAKTITISRKMAELNSTAEVVETILHEIAHAIEWEHWKTAGHGERWRAIAAKVGCKQGRCYGSDVVKAVARKGR